MFKYLVNFQEHRSSRICRPTYVLELLLTTKRFEAITEILDDAGMFDTYDPLLRHNVARSDATSPGGGRCISHAIVSHVVR